MSRRVRHIIHLSSANIWRGAEQQIIYLYKGLNQHHYHQNIFCLEHSPLAIYCAKNNLPHVTYTKSNGLNYNLALVLKKYHQEIPIDFIHIHDPHAHHGYLLAYLLGLKVPAILHRRVDFPTANHILSVAKYNIKGIRRIICVSKGVQNIFYPHPKIYSKTQVVYDCVDIDFFQKMNIRSSLLKEYPQLNNKFVVANIAALVDHKDHVTYLNAVHYIVKVLKRTDIHFLIIGDGEKKEDIQQMIKDFYLEEYVSMTGHRKDMNDVLNSIDLYTFTSKKEGFGSTILEVMSAQIPIVATKVGGPAEILSHEKDALLVHIGDNIGLAHQIIKIVDHPILSKKITQEALKTVKKFSIQLYTEQIEQIYNSIEDDIT